MNLKEVNKLKGGDKMNTGITITLIICVTIILLTLISRGSGKK